MCYQRYTYCSLFVKFTKKLHGIMLYIVNILPTEMCTFGSLVIYIFILSTTHSWPLRSSRGLLAIIIEEQQLKYFTNIISNRASNIESLVHSCFFFQETSEHSFVNDVHVLIHKFSLCHSWHKAHKKLIVLKDWKRIY